MSDNAEEDGRLPKESHPQKIGKQAVSAFEHARPAAWSVHSLEGDDDYGLDKQIQVPDNTGRIVGLFFAQIKGSRHDQRNADGKYFSVRLKTRTLNYYARIEAPVMLAFVDLSSGCDPREAPVYWTWISEDIRRLLGGQSDFSDFGQKSLSVQVPIENEFTRNLDIVAELAVFRRRANALKGLCHSVGLAMDDAMPLDEAISTISRTVRRFGRPLMSAFAESAESRWLEAPAGTIRAYLKDAYELLLKNEDNAAEEVLGRIDEQISLEGTRSERADFDYLRGKVRWLRGDQEEAIEHYRRAQGQDEQILKYHLAYLEAQFSTVYPHKLEAVERILESTRDTDDDEIVCFKARMLGALGDIDGGLRLIECSISTAAQIARALLMYLKKDWPGTIHVCTEGLRRDDLKENQRALFQVFKARALYYMFISQELEPNCELPPFGSDHMDFETGKAAWREAKEALRLLRKSNWPANSEHIVDVINLLATTLNREREILIDLRDLCQRRPHLIAANEALHRLATVSGDEELALEALSRLPDTDDTLHQRILVLHGSGRHAEAVELAERKLLTMDSSNKLHGACLGTAALSAHALVAPERARPFEEQLREAPELVGDAAVYRYIFACNNAPLSRVDALLALYSDFEKYPDSVPIQDNLFPALDARNMEQARYCVRVAGEIRDRRRFALREIVHLAQAHTTLEDWTALLAHGSGCSSSIW